MKLRERIFLVWVCILRHFWKFWGVLVMIGYLGYFKVFSNILGYFKVFLDNWDFLGYLDIFGGYWDY